MKKTILLLLLLISETTFSQNFPASNIELLSGKELKVLPKKENLQKNGYYDFYTDENLKKVYDENNTYNSKYSSLVGKIFKVIEILPYKTILGKDEFKLLIENNETGKLYFKYDPEFDANYPFEVIGGLKFPEDFYCKKITKTVDKFTGKTEYNTNSGGIFFLKVVKGKISKIYLSINQPGATLTIGKKGLTILLENNKKIEKPNADIKANSNGSGGYYNSTFVELTLAEINLLKVNNMTDLRLYVNDSEVENGTKYKELLKCLTK